MEKGLLDKTGKPLAEWITIVKGTGIEKHGEIIKYLKENHAFTHGYANFVAMKTRSADAASHDNDELVSTQYKGKEALLPIYKGLLAEVKKLGEDVEVVPKKASVSLRRKRQFLLIQPSTKTRIDLGLKFNDRPVAGRLESSGPFGSMCTHRVQITDNADVDAEVLGWIKEAYEEAG